MAHDEHFLERSAERVAPPEMQRSLQLYRDPELVRYILEHAKLPQDQQRVALAFDDGSHGPYVVVARDGGFVTCLGAGMRPNHLHVVAHANWTALIERKTALRVARGHLDRMSDGPNLLAQSLDGPYGHSRESMVTLEQLAPIAATTYATSFFKTAQMLERRWPNATSLLKATKWTRTERTGLRAHGQLVYSLANDVVLLTTLGEPEWTDDLLAVCDVGAQAAYQRGTVMHAARAAWAIAFVGEPMFERLQTHYTEPHSDAQFQLATLALLIAALRHPQLRQQVLVLFNAEPPPQCPEAHRMVRQECLAVLAVIGSDVARCAQIQVAVGRAVYEQVLLLQGISSEQATAVAEAAPESTVLPFALYMPGNPNREVTVYTGLLTMAPWLALARLPDLYLPEAVRAQFWRPMTAEFGAQVMARELADRRVETVRYDAKVGRNDPCSCGSGKKFKKCCGR